MKRILAGLRKGLATGTRSVSRDASRILGFVLVYHLANLIGFPAEKLLKAVIALIAALALALLKFAEMQS